MTDRLRPYSWTLILGLVGIVVGLVYSLTTKPVYQAQTHALMMRLKLEPGAKSVEESKNRWIWVRDGLAVKESLLSDEALDDFIQQGNWQQSLEKINSKQSSLPENLVSKEQLVREELRRIVRIDFTGADDYRYLISVKTSSAEMALALTKYLLNRLEYLLVSVYHHHFIDSVKSYGAIVEPHIKNQSFVDELIKMRAEHAFEQAQRRKSFLIIKKPELLPNPIWPQKKLILVLGLLVGVFFGLAIDFLRYKKN